MDITECKKGTLLYCYGKGRAYTYKATNIYKNINDIDVVIVDASENWGKQYIGTEYPHIKIEKFYNID